MSQASVRAFELPGWAIFLLMQLGWFACVLGAARGHFWLGPLTVLALLALHLHFSRERLLELELIVAMGVVGVTIDSTLMCLELLEFRGALMSCVAPPWIAALWLHFGTGRHSLLRALRDRLALAFAVGILAGPLAYGAGVRLGAASFHPETWRSVLALAFAWGAVLPFAVWFTWHRVPASQSSPRSASSDHQTLE